MKTLNIQKHQAKKDTLWVGSPMSMFGADVFNSFSESNYIELNKN